MTKKSKNTQNENTEIVEDVLEETEDVIKETNLQEELNSLKDQYQRTLAEYDNFKKRTIKEKEAIYTDSVGETVAKLLPVLDNISRAVNSFADKESEYFKGVDLILRQTNEIFSNLGVEEIKSVGEMFDPQIHNAVLHIEDETVDDNTIVEELQKGYTYKGKVIRYAMVKVAN